MARRMKTLLLSCMSIVLCIMVLVAGSFALFTDTARVQNHLQAGRLDVTLKRIALTTTKLDANGYMLTKNEQTTADEPVDFSGGGGNVFGLSQDEVIAPCTVLQATMQISNDSDVAFGYWIEFTADGDENFRKQLKISVTPQGGNTITQYLSDGVTIGSETNAVAILAATGEAKTFVVKVEFENIVQGADSHNNNQAQGKDCSIDVIVHATQVTENPNA